MKSVFLFCFHNRIVLQKKSAELSQPQGLCSFDDSCPFAHECTRLGNPGSYLFEVETLFGTEEQKKRARFSSSVSWGLREEPPWGTVAIGSANKVARGM